MTEKDVFICRVNALIDNTVRCETSEMTYIDIIGALEIVKFDLLREGVPNEDDGSEESGIQSDWPEPPTTPEPG